MPDASADAPVKLETNLRTGDEILARITELGGLVMMDELAGNLAHIPLDKMATFLADDI